jgi:hypothetical protein
MFMSNVAAGIARGDVDKEEGTCARRKGPTTGVTTSSQKWMDGISTKLQVLLLLLGP